ADSLPSLDAWPDEVANAADWRLWHRIVRNNPDRPIGYCRVPTMLHFSARWKNSRHASMDEFATMLEVADSADWWPAALRVSIPDDLPEQAAFAKLMQADPVGWAARIRQAAADLATRFAWK